LTLADVTDGSIVAKGFSSWCDVPNAIAIRGKCPICGEGPLKPLPVDFDVNVSKLGQKQHVGGLLVYQCTKNGHVFFVMARDAEKTFEDFCG
jgi:hypothetical protein